MGKLIKFWFEEWHCNFTPNSYIWYTSKIPIQPNNYRSNFTTCLLYNTFGMPCVPWNIKSEISKPIKHCIANKIIKMSHILHIDKPEDCACAAEKSTLPHQTEVSNGLCSGTILSKQPIFKNYNTCNNLYSGEWYLVLNSDLSDWSIEVFKRAIGEID